MLGKSIWKAKTTYRRFGGVFECLQQALVCEFTLKFDSWSNLTHTAQLFKR